MTLNERESRVFFHTYKRIPFEVSRGEGMHLYDGDGRAYLDFFGGLAVNALGHCHRRVVEAITRQAARYAHVSNFYLQDVQIELAERLSRMSGMPRVFLSNAGAEAVEGALKLARKWGATRGKKTLVGFTNSFHGRTFAALSLMDNPKYRADIDPFIGDTKVLPFNDCDALRAALDEHTCAVLFEPVQGEGGVVPATRTFVDTLIALREQHGFLIIADEIQSGIGRTGTFLAVEQLGLEPDVVTVAKALGGGLPLAAILGVESLVDVWHPGEHGSTFGGNPIACAAGCAVLEELERGVMASAARVGLHLLHGLRELQQRVPTKIRDVRGMGLMIGVELTEPGEPIVTAMRDRGVLINCTRNTVLRLVPPLIATKQDCDVMLNTLDDCLHVSPPLSALQEQQSEISSMSSGADRGGRGGS